MLPSKCICCCNLVYINVTSRRQGCLNSEPKFFSVHYKSNKRNKAKLFVVYMAHEDQKCYYVTDIPVL